MASKIQESPGKYRILDRSGERFIVFLISLSMFFRFKIQKFSVGKSLASIS